MAWLFWLPVYSNSDSYSLCCVCVFLHYTLCVVSQNHIDSSIMVVLLFAVIMNVGCLMLVESVVSSQTFMQVKQGSCESYTGSKINYFLRLWFWMTEIARLHQTFDPNLLFVSVTVLLIFFHNLYNAIIFIFIILLLPHVSSLCEGTVYYTVYPVVP